MKIKRILSAFLTAVMLLSVLTVGMTATAALPYTDVDEGSWSYEGIKYVTENGLMNGTGGTSFGPAVSLTRSMVVTVLYRMEGSPRVRFKELFLDVEDRKFYSEAVVWAKENGIVNGTGYDEWGEEYFSPDRDITRQELATMFVRYANRKYIVTETDATLDKYTDKAEVDSWAADALKWATDIELIKGTGSGDTLSPKGKATREQFATIMYRFCEQSEFEYKHNLSEPEPLSTYTEKPYPLVDDADVYVAVDGNDKNPGTKEKPLATFDAARLKVRELKKTAKDEIVVAFMAGEYGSLDNVTFTAEDGGSETVPIKYCKYGDGEVKFCNGVYIYEEEFVPVEGAESEIFKKEVRDNIYKAEIGDRIKTFGFNTRLFTETGLALEAREPNGDFITNMTTTVDPWASIKLQIALPGIVEKFSSYDGLKINGYLRAGWIFDCFYVKSYDAETDILEIDFENSKGDYWLKYPNYELMYEGRTDDLVFFSNLPEFIDTPGEYCFDNKTSTLYVYSPKGDYAIDGGVEFATIEEGAEYISFVGLDFSTTSMSGIMLYADHFTFDMCKIGNISGKAAIYAPHYVSHFTAKNSEFYNCVDNCIYTNYYDEYLFDPKDPSTQEKSYNVITNNYFHDFTLPDYFSSAIHINDEVGTVISHNYFYQGGHGGVWYGSCVGTRIEYNVFDEMMTKTEDFGAVYTCGSVEYKDNITRYNIFKNGRVIGVYLDCNSSGQEIYGNIFYKNANAIAQNGGKDNIINGNVFIEGYDAIGPAPLTYMNQNAAFGIKVYGDMSTAVGEKNGNYSVDENPFFVNPSIGDYSIREGVDFYDIPFEKIGRY